MVLAVRGNKQAQGFVLLNDGKSYLLTQYLRPKQGQPRLDKWSQFTYALTQQLDPVMDYGSLPNPASPHLAVTFASTLIENALSPRHAA